MKLTALNFNPTKDFKDFAESFRRSVLQDDALREYVKRRQGIDPEHDKSPVSEEDILQALDALGNELEAKDAAMAAHVRNLAAALRNLEIVADNIRDEGNQRPDEEASQTAQTAWAQAAACLDALGGQEPEAPSMLETAKTYLKGGKHEELEEADRDADDLYNAIQSDPAGKLLLRAGHLAADGMMKGSLLERKVTFSNFLYRDHELGKMDRQAEIDYFSEISEETKDILLMDAEAQQKKAAELEKEYIALQEQVRNKAIWFHKHPEAQNALNDFKASEEIQALYRKTARDRAYRQTQAAAQKYREQIGARNEKNKNRNFNITKENEDIDRRREALEKEKQTYEQQCRELEGRIPQGQTQEDAYRKLRGNVEEPSLIKNRIESTRNTIAMQEQLEKRLAQAMEYPRLFKEMKLSPEAQRRQEQLEAKQRTVNSLKQLQLKNRGLSRGKGRGLNLTMTDAERPLVLKACSDLKNALTARDKALDELLSQYQRGLSYLKPGDKDLENKKARLAETYENRLRKLRSEHKVSVDKALEKINALMARGLDDQTTVLYALTEGERLFPAKKSAFSLELFGPMGARRLEELIDSIQKETNQEANELRKSNSDYFKIKDYMQSPVYLGSNAGGQTVRGYKDWSPEELQQALEQTQKGIETFRAKLRDEEKLLETNQKIYEDEAEKRKVLPTNKQVDDAKAALNSYRDTEKARLDAVEKSIPEKQELIRIFTDEELGQLAENRHLHMTEQRSRELDEQVRLDLSSEVENLFHEQNPMRKNFKTTARERMTAIDAALNQVRQMQQEDNPIRRLYAQRQQNYTRNQTMLQTWENQLAAENPYPEQVKNRLEELYRQINAGRKRGHNDTELFQAMSGALTTARNFLAGEHGDENLAKLRRFDQETMDTFRGMLQELNRASAEYETKRKKGIHWIPSNMHYVRLDLARNLQNFVADTQAGLTEMQAVEEQRLQDCRDAIDAAREQEDAEPMPPETLEAFISDAFELSRDPERAQKQHIRNQLNREQEIYQQTEQNANDRHQLKQQLDSAQNNRSGAAADFSDKEKQLNLMYNMQRWGGEMVSLLADMQKNPGKAEDADAIKQLHSVAVNIRNLGNISAMTMEYEQYRAENSNNRAEEAKQNYRAYMNKLDELGRKAGIAIEDEQHQVEDGEGKAQEAEQDSNAFIKKLADMGERLQQLQAAEKLFPEGSPERQRFGYIARQLILECNGAAAQLNRLNPNGEPLKADYPVPQEPDARSMKAYREAHHIQTGELASGETVELGWQMQQREEAVGNMLREAVNRSQQAREALNRAANNLQRKLTRGTVLLSAQADLDDMFSVLNVLTDTENKWNEKLKQYRADPARRQESFAIQTLKDMEQLGSWAEQALLPYADADLAAEQDNLNRTEQERMHQLARESFVLAAEGLMQWGNYARQRLQTLNPLQEAPQADNLQEMEVPEELKPDAEEVAADNAPADDVELNRAVAEENAREVNNADDKVAGGAAPEIVPEQPEIVPEQPEEAHEQPENVPEQPEEIHEQPARLPDELLERKSAMESACMHLNNLLDDMREHLINPDGDEAEQPEDKLTDEEKEQLAALEQVHDRLYDYISSDIDRRFEEEKSQTSEEAVQEMQELSRLALEKLPLLQKAAVLPIFAKALPVTLKKLVEVGNGAVEWLKSVQPDTSVQKVELSGEVQQAQEADDSLNQAKKQQEAEELERQKAKEADQASLREEQQKLDAMRKQLEEEYAAQTAERNHTMNVLWHPGLRTPRLQRLLAASTLSIHLQSNLDELDLSDSTAQNTIRELSAQLQEFNEFADGLNFEARADNVQEERKQEECLSRLAILSKNVYEKAMPIVAAIEDPEAKALLRQELEGLAEHGNWAVDEFKQMNPLAYEMEKTELIREEPIREQPAPQEENPAPQEEQPAPQEENPAPQEKQEQPAPQPQPAKRQTAQYNRDEMKQLLVWCDTIEKLNNKYFKDKVSVIEPANYALMLVRRNVNNNLPNVDESGKWLDKDPDNDPTKFKERLAMSDEDRYEYSGEYLKKTFVSAMSSSAEAMTDNLLPIHTDMLKMYSSFQLENPGMGNDALAKDILKMNEALRGLMLYGKDATKDFNNGVLNTDRLRKLPEPPPLLKLASEDIVGVDIGKLLNDNLRAKSWEAMDAVAEMENALPRPVKPVTPSETMPLEVYIEREKDSARFNEEKLRDEKYLRNRATAVRMYDVQRRDEKIKKAEADYREDCNLYKRRCSEFTQTHNIVQGAYELAIQSSKALRENKDQYASPTAQMDLYGKISDKLTEAVSSIQTLQHNAAQEGTIIREQEKTLNETAMRLARLSNYTAQLYNKLAAESKADIAPIPEIDLMPLINERVGWQKEEQLAKEKEALDRELARKRREEERKRELEEKNERNRKKTTEVEEVPKVSKDEKEYFGIVGRIKKYLADKEKAEEFKQWRLKQREWIITKQWESRLRANLETFRSVAKLRNVSEESFIQDMKEHFWKATDAQRDKMDGVIYPMPGGIRDDETPRSAPKLDLFGRKEKAPDKKKDVNVLGK